MDIEKFILLRPFLYHLTDALNIPSIIRERQLFSTVNLVNRANVPNAETFLRTRRIGHRDIGEGKFAARLRDQDPLFRKIVVKNLTDGWSFEDFVYSLNSRVFFWCTESDLRKHYIRYENQDEFPKILKFNTEELFKTNENNPQFCNLNSGAPRCSAYYIEGAPPRGPKSFLDKTYYVGVPSSVREVTFVDKCILPTTVWIASHPDKMFKRIG